MKRLLWNVLTAFAIIAVGALVYLASTAIAVVSAR